MIPSRSQVLHAFPTYSWPLSPVATFGTLRRYTGSSWVKATLQYYDGVSFTTRPLKRFNGSSWVIVDTTGE